ncbi:MAG: tRNA (adenosine(37)-N6)-threonylcarbamoyltransferase complex transferase subunit TsaD [Candidatus Staskawiczbacteria bacterium]|nr:tRNA (adenosine(37)-N6)-threonylcarbamoyltransferase complex transferase subunit TsaD [Candidatus Staskawiczbacteria bacterium]
MKILAIETSCDDTGIAILEVSKTGDFAVKANVIASQVKIGKKYGGVYPMMAKREHQKNILPALISALEKARMLKKPDKSPKEHFDGPATISLEASLGAVLEREPELLKKIIPFFKKYEKPDVDLISVTNGPGLEPCLWVGINFAKCLSYFWNIPIVPVNHTESHILVNTLENKNIKFPAIALVVSGGHTQIILVKGKPHFAKASRGAYKILGETRDDAAGECFDKCAKILGLGYPGGPIISKLAVKSVGCRTSHRLPRPMMGSGDYDFSFSGLKTAVLYQVKKDKNNSMELFNKEYKMKMAAEIQQAIIDVLIKKTIKAGTDYKAKTIILGGGVSANQELRKQFLEFSNEFKIIFPKPELSTDNGLMIAIAGFYHKNKITNWKKISANGNLRIN